MRPLDQQKEALDLVTDAMYSISFLDTYNKILFSPDDNKISILDFYNTWLSTTNAPEPKMPFSLGIFTGYLFCGLLITKENWSDLLPNKTISKLDKEWGLNDVLVTINSLKNEPGLPYFIRRLRNSLGHTNFTIHIPSAQEMHSINELHNLVKWSFTDYNPHDPNDTFEVTLTMTQLEILIKKFQSLVHQTIRNTPLNFA